MVQTRAQAKRAALAAAQPALAGAQNAPPFTPIPADVLSQLSVKEEIGDVSKSVPEARPNCAAVLIGCEYPNTTAALPGCYNDVRAMLQVAQSRYGCSPDGYIQVLWDKIPSSDSSISGSAPAKNRSTLANIERALETLVEFAARVPSAELLLFYSGHGTSIPDDTGDEVDKKDEALLPSDFASEGLLTDDWLYDRFLARLPETAVCRMLFDACHSGSILDVDRPSKMAQIKAKFVCVSGCTDAEQSFSVIDKPESADQEAAEQHPPLGMASVGSAAGQWCGALTAAFVRAVSATNLKPGNLDAVKEEMLTVVANTPSARQNPVITTNEPLLAL